MLQNHNGSKMEGVMNVDLGKTKPLQQKELKKSKKTRLGGFMSNKNQYQGIQGNARGRVMLNPALNLFEGLFQHLNSFHWAKPLMIISTLVIRGLCSPQNIWTKDNCYSILSTFVTNQAMCPVNRLGKMLQVESESTQSEITTQNAEKYKVSSWVYIGILDASFTYPRSYLCFKILSFAKGSPNNIGIGITLFETYGNPFIDPPAGLVGILPFSVYYASGKWNNHGLAFPATYTSLSMNIITKGVPIERYLWVRTGITWFCAGFEAGCILPFNNNRFSFYGGITLSLGGWFGTTVKKEKGGEK